MANKKIEQLTNDTSVNMSVNDLLPVAKYVSPGVYNTVFKNGSNIINTITGLPTASFTNINTSINNVSSSIIPTTLNYLNILAVTQSIGQSISSGSNFFISCTLPIGTMDPMKAYIIDFKIYAWGITTQARHVQEYKIVFTNNNTILNATTAANAILDVFDTSGADITLNPTNIGFHSGSNSLRFTASHTIAGEFITIYSTATIYSI